MMPTAEAARNVLSAWSAPDLTRLDAELDRAARAPYPAAEDERHEFLEALIGEIRSLSREPVPDPAAARLCRRLLTHLAQS